MIEQQVRYIHQRFMHPVLRIEKVEWVASFNQSVKERSWPLNFECISRAKLLLIAYKNNLFSMNRSEESFILLNHGGFIHYHSIELSVTEGLRAWFANSCYNYRSVFKNLIFKLHLVLHKDFKLVSCQHFDCLYIITKEADVLFFNC